MQAVKTSQEQQNEPALGGVYCLQNLNIIVQEFHPY